METETKTENRTRDSWPQLGGIYETRGVNAWMDDLPGCPRADFAAECLRRYMTGDWGDMEDEDKGANDAALLDGSRVFAAYNFRGRRVWIITEAENDDGEREYTTILFPSEY